MMSSDRSRRCESRAIRPRQQAIEIKDNICGAGFPLAIRLGGSLPVGQILPGRLPLVNHGGPIDDVTGKPQRFG